MEYSEARKFLDTLPDWERGRPPAGPLHHYLPRTRALLRRLGDPQNGFRSIIVGGTNGKGTVASLLEALLRGDGRIGLYTSPHLHSQRERIQVDGLLLGPDDWADAVTFLYDATRRFDEEGFGGFSKFEALTALAAHLFSAAGVDYALFEVGLGGRYDATNAWDHELSVLTSIAVDHADVLGEDVLEITADKLCITRPGRPLFTTDAHEAGVAERIRNHCQSASVPLYTAVPGGVTRAESSGCGPGGPYPACPRSEGSRPGTYPANARLALAAAAFLLGDRLVPADAEATIARHQWPGRFEAVERDGKPLVLLDGAHNRAAAAGLSADLRALHPKWRFVVGVGSGHDAGAILDCLAPLAGQVIATSSGHPKALPPEDLLNHLPAEVPATVEPLARALEVAASGKLPVCVTGSLALVARAREHFRLPCETEGISEDVALESLECVEIACRARSLRCERVSDNDNLLRVDGAGGPFYFLRNRHPFNDYAAARLAEDKGYQYELFAAAGLPVPCSMQVFNPYADDRFHRYKTHGSVEEMLDDLGERMQYPLLIKKPRASVSQGVYLERCREGAARRLENLFTGGGFLDNSLLIQAFVEGVEYRIVASEAELLLAYEKTSDEVGGGLNPLHHASGRAVRVGDGPLLAAMTELTRRVAAVIRLGFYAIDVIDGPGGLRILELNPNPFCFFYNRSNGRGDFVAIYQHLLDKYLLRT